MAEDYYALLGVEPDASERAILRAYRERAAEEHPDVSDDPDAEARFQRLSRAKDVLTDPERRRAYDRAGHERFVEGDDHEPRGDGSVDVARGTGSTDAFAGGAVDVGSLIDRLFGGRDRHPGPGRGTTRRPKSARPAPAEVDLRAHYARPWTATTSTGTTAPGSGAATGPAASVSTTREERTACPRCSGRGAIVHVIDTARGRRRRLERCEECGGTGRVPA